MKTEDRELKEAAGQETLRRAGVPACLRVTGHEARGTTCINCVYARRPAGRWLRLILSRWLGLLFCTNHPDFPGEVIGVPPCSRCRNFRAKDERRTRTEVPNPLGPLVCQIPLTRGKVALVDAADYPWLSRYRWCFSPTRGGSCYAVTSIRGKAISMHRLIMNPPKGMWVHHRDDNGLNNCRDNLCICTRQQNAQRHRRRKTGATSPFIGVYQRKDVPDKWYAGVESGPERACLGPFHSPIEAARARDRKAIELHGEFARLNFPEEREQRLREIEEERSALDRDSRRDAETQG